MAHFEDLSPYTYCADDNIETEHGWTIYSPRYDRFNVGWLDAPHAFATGPAPDWLPELLLDIISAGPRINVMRGFHPCTICPGEPAGEIPEAGHRAGAVPRGNAEIRVPAEEGAMFAAPTLIGHYVTAHRYRPPAVFAEAVKRYPRTWMREPSPWIPDDAEHLGFG